MLLASAETQGCLSPHLCVTRRLNVPCESFHQAWFHFRMLLCRTRACVCTHAVRCVTEHPRLMPQLMPGHLQNTGRNGCLGSSHDIGKDQWQNQIKCHLDCSERKDCLTSARQRICSSPFLFGSSFSFPSKPPSFFSPLPFQKQVLQSG